MTPNDLIRALAILTALERPSDARTAAALLPDWFDPVDAWRAADAAQQLCVELTRLRKTAA